MIELVDHFSLARQVPVARVDPFGGPLFQLQVGSNQQVSVPSPIEQGWVYTASLPKGIKLEGIDGYQESKKTGGLNKFWLHQNNVYFYADTPSLTTIEPVVAFGFQVSQYIKNWQVTVTIPVGMVVERVENLGLSSDGGHLTLSQKENLLFIGGEPHCFLKPKTKAIAFGRITLRVTLVGPAFTISLAADPPSFTPSRLSWFNQIYNRVAVLTSPNTFTFSRQNQLVAISTDESRGF